MKMLCVLSKQQHLLEAAITFLNHDATHEEIASAGNKCLVALYGGGEDDSLNALRYGIFLRSAANAKVHLARLPPTEEAAAQHSYRTYHQVQMWLGVEKEPTNWGWTTNQQGLTPVTTTKEPAPLTLLKFLSCKCQKGCRGRSCSCQRAGLKCSALCKVCQGKTCLNTPPLDMADESDEEDNVDDPLPFDPTQESPESQEKPSDEPGPSWTTVSLSA